MVQLRQALDRELLWDRGIDVLVLCTISEDFVENVVGEGGLILEEYFQSLLHPVERGRLPSKLNCILAIRL